MTFSTWCTHYKLFNNHLFRDRIILNYINNTDIFKNSPVPNWPKSPEPHEKAIPKELTATTWNGPIPIVTIFWRESILGIFFALDALSDPSLPNVSFPQV